MTAELPAEELELALVHRLNFLATTEHLLVALDFDGTMSPLVPRAEDARPLPENAQAFAALASLPRTTTALVSGRALGSLRVVASPTEETLLVGSHGAETYLGPDSKPIELDDSQKTALNLATETLEDLTPNFPGTSVEYKPAGVVLHYRQAEDSVGQEAARQARERLAVIPGLYVSEGKMVLEVSVVKADKGQSIQMLRELTGATAVLFAGDDVTDETALATLQTEDVGIKVGPGQTAARFRISGPEQLAAVLNQLAIFRR